MPQGPMASPLMKPFVVLALPGMYLFYKYNQYKRKRKENAKRRLTERELQHLHNKICADVVVLLGEVPKSPYKSVVDLTMEEGDRMVSYATECTKFAPKAVIVVACPPVSVFMPVVESIYKKSDWYHPGRVIGSVGYAEAKANCLAAAATSMDPQICSVPIIGGPDIDTAVPLFSRAQPATIPLEDCPKLLSKFRGVDVSRFPQTMKRTDYFEMSALGEATGLSRLITRIALGLCGDKNACSCAFVRSNLLPTCLHVATTVQFGQSGLYHNFGIPELHEIEMKLFTNSLLTIKERENVGKDFVGYAEGDKDPAGPHFLIKQQLMENAKDKKVITEFMID